MTQKVLSNKYKVLWKKAINIFLSIRMKLCSYSILSFQWFLLIFQKVKMLSKMCLSRQGIGSWARAYSSFSNPVEMGLSSQHVGRKFKLFFLKMFKNYYYILYIFLIIRNFSNLVVKLVVHFFLYKVVFIQVLTNFEKYDWFSLTFLFKMLM